MGMREKRERYSHSPRVLQPQPRQQVRLDVVVSLAKPQGTQSLPSHWQRTLRRGKKVFWQVHCSRNASFGFLMLCSTASSADHHQVQALQPWMGALQPESLQKSLSSYLNSAGLGKSHGVSPVAAAEPSICPVPTRSQTDGSWLPFRSCIAMLRPLLDLD